MEKIKKFMSSPKKTAILGFIGGIMMLIYTIDIFNLFINKYMMSPKYCLFSVFSIGIVIYFIAVLSRLYMRMGSIKVANIFLLITTIISFIVYCLMLFGYIFLRTSILQCLMYLIMIVYFISIFYKKILPLGNKIFAVSIVLYVIYEIIAVFESINLLIIINCIGYLLIIPYFYNYYELLKEEK